MKLLLRTRLTSIIMGLLICLPATAGAKAKSVIVGFHEKPGPSEQALIHEAKGKVKRKYRMIPAMAVELSEKEIEKIKKHRKVAYVEEDGLFAAVEPLPGVEYINAWGVLHIGADIAHVAGNRGAGVRVAVIDTGIDYTHPDLDDNVVDGINFVQTVGGVDPHDFFDYSSRSHGTHVAGVIAAEANGFGAVGVAPEAELYAVRVLDGGGFGLLSWIIAGIEWAVENQMDVANLSVEGPHFESLQAACDSAYDAGVLLVAAAGNIGQAVRYPAAYESVVAVSATDASDMKAFLPSGPEVELAAPGVDIESTVAGGVYDVLSGSSQAAPHVVGTAALLLASHLEDMNGDGRLNDDVRQELQMTAIDLGIPGRDNLFGFGLVNAAVALPPVNVPSPFTISRTYGAPHHDAVTVSLSEAVFEVTVRSSGLKKINVEVLENGICRSHLSSSHRFPAGSTQAAVLCIDATGTTYDIDFVPIGRPGTSAEVVMTEKGSACNEQ